MTKIDYDRDLKVTPNEFLSWFNHFERTICKPYERSINEMIESKRHQLPKEAEPTKKRDPRCRDFMPLVMKQFISFTKYPEKTWIGVSGDCKIFGKKMRVATMEVDGKWKAAVVRGNLAINQVMKLADKAKFNPMRADGGLTKEQMRVVLKPDLTYPKSISDLFKDKCPSKVQETTREEVYYKLEKLWSYRASKGKERKTTIKLTKWTPPSSCPRKAAAAMQVIAGQLNRKSQETGKVYDMVAYMKGSIGYF